MGSKTLLLPPCDFCNERPALLFCKADTAKLCLACDQHVHSANTLSQKHVRTLICDLCRSQPASFSSHGLSTCHDCPGSSVPIEGFSGCPSPSQLASSLWALDHHLHDSVQTQGPNSLFIDDHPIFDSWASSDLLVPSFNHHHPKKNNNINIINSKQEAVIKQLREMEMERRDDGDVDELRDQRDYSVVPSGVVVDNDHDHDDHSLMGFVDNTHNLNNNININNDNGVKVFISEQEQETQQNEFTSLMDLSADVDFCSGHGRGNVMWHHHHPQSNTNPPPPPNNVQVRLM